MQFIMMQLHCIQQKETSFSQGYFQLLNQILKKEACCWSSSWSGILLLPASVKASIESKINAEQDAQKMTFVLQKETQEAQRKRVEAQGIADYQKILSTGLSDKLLQYEMIKAISVSPNAKVIFMTNGKNLPMIVDSK